MASSRHEEEGALRQRKEGREGETVWGRSRRSGGGGGGHPDCSLADGTERT